jgi:hypothetical protein
MQTNPSKKTLEDQLEGARKLCEIEGLEDFNCIDCSEFDSCQMILYDSYDSSDEEGNAEDSGLTLI